MEENKITEKFELIGDEYETRGERCLPVRLTSSFENRDVMAKHYIGKEIEIGNELLSVIGVESFTRGGTFNAGELVGMMVRPSKDKE